MRECPACPEVSRDTETPPVSRCPEVSPPTEGGTLGTLSRATQEGEVSRHESERDDLAPAELDALGCWYRDRYDAIAEGLGLYDDDEDEGAGDE